jgi:hypothetical protein
MTWEAVTGKLARLSEGKLAAGVGDQIASAVMHLDQLQASELTRLLEQVRVPVPAVGRSGSPASLGATRG